MSFSDSLENDLKNLERRGERDSTESRRNQSRRLSEKSRALAAAPFAERLRHGRFTADLLRHATRIGHGYRTKVHIIWLGTTLRLEAREHRLELRPTAEGVMAHSFLHGKETGKQKVDLTTDPEGFARKWLQTVGPPPPEPMPDLDEE